MASGAPAICICIPTRNRPAYLAQTLASVRAQGAGDFRVLVSDDASEAAPAAQVARHVAELGDPRVAYRHHAENLKEYDHGRFMFGQCREEFFAILHDDDRWEPSFLERSLDVLRRDASLACVTANQFCGDGQGARAEALTAAYQKRMGRLRYPEGRLPILEPLLTHSVFALSSTVFRSAALQASGLVDPDCHGNTIFDINLFLRLGERGELGYYLPEELAAYRIHHDRLTTSEERGGFNPRLLETFIAVLERRRFSGRSERERRRQLSSAYHNYAMLCYLRGDTAGMRRYVGKCVRTSPWRWKNWAYAALAGMPFLIRPMLGARGRLATALD